ncbi:hypothetical protein CIG75_04470 [Tumebacillus algifaecis]|uniref:Uncharacterized protein n=1 Tax=Tumebacillus algifaecis TaxID=1214604 RepID=A0A223CYR2_9BACL|nr:hypothetical protein [Tumebacillus algifaecis]ASS74314.1 hypothetical protein CIG75_04470 [Tumebacillus algifaecis]
MSGEVANLTLGKVAVAALQILSEAVEQQSSRREEFDWPHGAEERLAGQVLSWMEQFVGGSLGERRKELGLQMRAELMALLGEIEPQLAMALLCSLPGAERRGYTWSRLAVNLGVSDAQIATWEAEAQAQLGERVTERTPFLAYLKGQATAVGGPASEHIEQQALRVERLEQEEVSFSPKRSAEERFSQEQVGKMDAVAHADSLEDLVEMARSEASFDLRRYVGADIELRIRQAFHRVGVEELEQVAALFATEDRLAVTLIGARLQLELGGEEGRVHG